MQTKVNSVRREEKEQTDPGDKDEWSKAKYNRTQKYYRICTKCYVLTGIKKCRIKAISSSSQSSSNNQKAL